MLCANNTELKVQLPQLLGSWSDHVESWTNKSNLPIYVLRYEDMLENPFHSFSGALQFLGMKYKMSEIENAIKRSSFNSMKMHEEKLGFMERSILAKSFFRKGIMGEWKNVLTNSQIDKIIQHHAEIMRKFGYLDSQY